jgi:colicin import membrane protein
MARPGINYDQVENAINELLNDKESVTIQSIREQLGGTGSPNTIQRHLKAWKDANPRPTRKTVAVSESLLVALTSEIERQTESVRSVFDKELSEARLELDLLATEGEALEKEVEAVSLSNESLKASSEQLTADNKSIGDQLSKVEAGLESEREAHQITNKALAVAQAQLIELEAVKVERADLLGRVKNLEKESTVLEATNIQLDKRIEQAKGESKTLAEQLSKAQLDLSKALSDMSKVETALAVSQYSLGSAEIDIALMQSQLAKAEGVVSSERDKANKALMELAVVKREVEFLTPKEQKEGK